MTFDERVTALAPLGFTPRQTRFLVTAAYTADIACVGNIKRLPA